MRTRTYGTSGPHVVVVHGGPGTPGSMGPIARELAPGFRVCEPFQRGSGSPPLTVALHVADLHELIESLDSQAKPALVGHSWGAMLALAYAAAHPDRVGALVLIGCGTFDPAARRQMQDTIDERMDASLRERLDVLAEEFPDADQRLEAMGKLILPLYGHDLSSTNQEVEEHDARAHHETWDDMIEQQSSGAFPAAFAAITSPVLMLHGSSDPHPGAMIRDGLLPMLPQLDYREWEDCGHYPWLERSVREEFFEELLRWLTVKLAEAAGEARRAHTV